MRKPKTLCGFSGCSRVEDSKGLCTAHYQQQRAGRALSPIIERVPIDVRFFTKVNKQGPQSPTADGPCWLWTAQRVVYGRFRMPDRSHHAHRASWVLAYGAIPAGMLVCHKCDTPLCVRPDHLFLGTHADNAADRKRKGRCATGERNGNAAHPERRSRGDAHWTRKTPELVKRGAANGAAVLSTEQVEHIRQMLVAGMTNVHIASVFGVGTSTISRIRNGKAWL